MVESGEILPKGAGGICGRRQLSAGRFARLQYGGVPFGKRRLLGKTHEKVIERVYNTYGYYFGQIRVAPQQIIHHGRPCPALG